MDNETVFLVVYQTGQCIVSLEEPPTLENVRMSQPHESWASAWCAKNAYNVGLKIASERDAAAISHDKLLAQAEIVRKKNDEIDSLKAELERNRKVVDRMRNVLENVEQAIALDCALERTHQQRNYIMRAIVRVVHSALSAVSDIEDIPF